MQFQWSLAKAAPAEPKACAPAWSAQTSSNEGRGYELNLTRRKISGGLRSENQGKTQGHNHQPTGPEP